MIESLYIAETGMNSQQELIEIISNNLANVNTAAFKSESVSFVDLVYQPTGNQLDNLSSNQQTKGIGVDVGKKIHDFSMGSLKQTGNPLDVAINGNGFLEVMQPNGEAAFTRAGRLRINEDGFLASSQGFKLSDNIQIPTEVKDITITASGSVLVKIPSENRLIEIGKISIANFTNVQGLTLAGNNLYQASQTSGQVYYSDAGTNGTGQLVQGFTEQSNVSMNEEMVNLMLAQRGYQLNARIIQVSDQILETINNLRR